MADVIAAPQNYVVPDRHVMLDDIVLEYKAVFADYGVPPDERSGANVARRSIAFGLRSLVESSPDAVQLRERDGHKYRVPGRRKPILNVLERDDGQAVQFVLRPVSRLDGESDHVVRGVVGEVLVGDLGELTVADNDQRAGTVGHGILGLGP